MYTVHVANITIVILYEGGREHVSDKYAYIYTVNSR